MVFLLEDIHEHCLSHALLDDGATDPVAIFPSLPNTIGGTGNQAVHETPWGKPTFCRFFAYGGELVGQIFCFDKTFFNFHRLILWKKYYVNLGKKDPYPLGQSRGIKDMQEMRLKI